MTDFYNLIIRPCETIPKSPWPQHVLLHHRAPSSSCESCKTPTPPGVQSSTKFNLQSIWIAFGILLLEECMHDRTQTQRKATVLLYGSSRLPYPPAQNTPRLEIKVFPPSVRCDEMRCKFVVSCVHWQASKPVLVEIESSHGCPVMAYAEVLEGFVHHILGCFLRDLDARALLPNPLLGHLVLGGSSLHPQAKESFWTFMIAFSGALVL